MSNNAFHIGLSMAGTVSAGTYTAGCMIELNRWLSKWQAAKQSGITLTAVVDAGNYKKGDKISFTAQEVPQHQVVISALSGASGGGVSAGLYACGMAMGKVEQLLHDTWMNFDVSDMLDLSDLKNGKKVYSLLNVKPIDDVLKSLMAESWPETNHSEAADYLDDVVEIYFTLASYEGIPYNVCQYQAASSKSYGVFKSHLDYIRFGFFPKANTADIDGQAPYRHPLRFSPGQALKYDAGWMKLLEASPATGAFPIGFKPRTVNRFRKEYDGKLFYLKYGSAMTEVPYDTLCPAWQNGTPEQIIEMEYFDGGAFNREPHDLARASLLRKLTLNRLPDSGKDAVAAVILIDPFPAQGEDYLPGEEVKGLPDLMGQISLLLNALMTQGRFRADWIEKAVDENNYSRFLISPIRKIDDVEQDLSLAGGLLGAFSGFIDTSFREHDYHLGHYNTYKFLQDYFVVTDTNKLIDYSRMADVALLEKYTAVGWFKPANGMVPARCEIIPRCEEPNLLNNEQPAWPRISRDKWEQVVGMAEKRGRELADLATEFGFLNDAKDWAIWKFVLQPRFDQFIESLEKRLRKSKLLR